MATSALHLDEHLPVSCEGCYLSYGDFCGTYFKDCEGLLKLLMRHGLVPEKKLCEKCGKEFRVDIR